MGHYPPTKFQLPHHSTMFDTPEALIPYQDPITL